MNDGIEAARKRIQTEWDRLFDPKGEEKKTRREHLIELQKLLKDEEGICHE